MKNTIILIILGITLLAYCKKRNEKIPSHDLKAFYDSNNYSFKSIAWADLQSYIEKTYNHPFWHTLQTGAMLAKKEIKEKQIPLHKVSLALIDSGVNTQHEAFEKLTIHCYRFPNYEPSKDCDGKDDHGTNMLGIIAGKGDLGFAIGEKLTVHFFQFNEINELMLPHFKMLKINVLNGSYSKINYDNSEKVLDRRMIGSDKLALFAVGNEGASNIPNYFKIHPNSILVAAHTPFGYTPIFSGVQHVTFTAPGTHTLVPKGTNEYQLVDGTSGAAASTSGTAILLKQVNNNLSPETIQKILQISAFAPTRYSPLTGLRNNKVTHYYSQLNTYRAYRLALNLNPQGKILNALQKRMKELKEEGCQITSQPKYNLDDAFRAYFLAPDHCHTRRKLAHKIMEQATYFEYGHFLLSLAFSGSKNHPLDKAEPLFLEESSKNNLSKIKEKVFDHAKDLLHKKEYNTLLKEDLLIEDTDLLQAVGFPMEGLLDAFHFFLKSPGQFNVRHSTSSFAKLGYDESLKIMAEKLKSQVQPDEEYQKLFLPILKEYDDIYFDWDGFKTRLQLMQVFPGITPILAEDYYQAIIRLLSDDSKIDKIESSFYASLPPHHKVGLLNYLCEHNLLPLIRFLAPQFSLQMPQDLAHKLFDQAVQLLEPFGLEINFNKYVDESYLNSTKNNQIVASAIISHLLFFGKISLEHWNKSKVKPALFEAMGKVSEKDKWPQLYSQRSYGGSTDYGFFVINEKDGMGNRTVNLPTWLAVTAPYFKEYAPHFPSLLQQALDGRNYLERKLSKLMKDEVPPLEISNSRASLKGVDKTFLDIFHRVLPLPFQASYLEYCYKYLYSGTLEGVQYKNAETYLNQLTTDILYQIKTYAHIVRIGDISVLSKYMKGRSYIYIGMIHKLPSEERLDALAYLVDFLIKNKDYQTDFLASYISDWTPEQKAAARKHLERYERSYIEFIYR